MTPIWGPCPQAALAARVALAALAVLVVPEVLAAPVVPEALAAPVVLAARVALAAPERACLQCRIWALPMTRWRSTSQAAA